MENFRNKGYKAGKPSQRPFAEIGVRRYYVMASITHEGLGRGGVSWAYHAPS